jgi:hypothetical protein
MPFLKLNVGKTSILIGISISVIEFDTSGVVIDGLIIPLLLSFEVAPVYVRL